MTGDGGVAGLFGVAVDLADTEDRAEGDVEEVMVGELDGVAPVVGRADGDD